MQDTDLMREFDQFVDYLDSCGVAVREDWLQFRELLSAPGSDLTSAERFLVQLKQKKEAANLQAPKETGQLKLVSPGHAKVDCGEPMGRKESIEEAFSTLFDAANSNDRQIFNEVSSLGRELADLRSSRKKLSMLSNLEVRDGELLEF